MTIDYTKQKDKKITVVEKSKTIQVDIETVRYFESDEHLVLIFHTDGEQPYHYINTIKKLETELNGIGFIRICQKRLVNMRYVQICCSKKHELHFTNGQILTVSRRKWHNVKEFFSRDET
jgi:DNA-binding LytR/AlgR family response regulator